MTRAVVLGTCAVTALLGAGCSGPSGASTAHDGAERRAPPIVDAKLRAWQAVTALDATQAASTGDTWTSIGPSPELAQDPVTLQYDVPYAGRVDAVAVSPASASTWLIAAEWGGVWKTTDGGTTWTPTTDAQLTLHSTAVAFAPGNASIAYATASENGSGGLLASSDGGSTWTLKATGPFSATDAAEILVDPANASHLVVGTEGFFFDAANMGIFVSTDGGATFTRTLAGRMTDLVRDPATFAHQYAARTNCCYDPASNPSGLTRSTDGGGTWTTVGGPWTTAATGVQSIELAVAPSNGSVVYAAMQYNDASASWHVFETTNAWAATPIWVELPTFPGGGVNELTVDPTNASTLYVGSVGLFRFSGGTYTDVSNAGALNGLHVDQRGFAWAGGRLIVADDGGVFSTTNGGTNWNNHNTSTLSIAQFYDGSLHPTNANKALGATQDDGTSLWTGTNAWKVVNWGDGFDNIFSLTNPDTAMATSSEDLDIQRTTDGFATTLEVDLGISSANRPFGGQFEQCPSGSDIVIAGTDHVWLTTNFFTSGAGIQPTWSSNSPALGVDPITRLAFAPSDTGCNTYAFGGNDGRLYVTQNRGASWTNLDPGNQIPDSTVGAVTFDPKNANILYVGLSTYGPPGHLYKTTNALSPSPTWTDVTPPSGNVAVNRVAVDPFDSNLVYVGTDLGVWRTTNAAATSTAWTHYGLASGLPYARIGDLVYNGGTDRLIAFSFGRGAFVFNPAVPSAPILSGTAGTNQDTLSWTSSIGARHYDVKRAASSAGPYTLLASVTAPATTYTDASPLTGTNYYVVTAVDTSGESANSNVVSLAPTRSSVPCTGAITVSGGQSGNFNTSGPVCYRTADAINGWGCSNFDGRSVAIDNTPVTCGALPVPPKWSDGYRYFAVTAGTYPWASFYWW